MAAGRCDTATVVANSGVSLAPGNALGPMVIGRCQEKGGRYDLAFATYTDFARKNPRARGVGAVRALAEMALRTQATQTAKRSPEFAPAYATIAKRRGKKIATIAIARKLLTRAWHLLHDLQAAGASAPPPRP